MTKNRRDLYLGVICAAVVVVLVATTAGAQTTPVQTPVETATAPAAPSETSPATVGPATPSQESLELPALSADIVRDPGSIVEAPVESVETPEEAVEYPRDLPRPDLTPGAVRSTSLLDVCPTGTQALRKISTATKSRIARAYGLPNRAGYTMDHLVPLGSGGADVEANIWPEPHANSVLKDRCEDKARKLACRGDLPLEAVQKGFMSNYKVFCASIGVPIQ